MEVLNCYTIEPKEGAIADTIKEAIDLILEIKPMIFKTDCQLPNLLKPFKMLLMPSKIAPTKGPLIIDI
jgi:hypothetical protein